MIAERRAQQFNARKGALSLNSITSELQTIAMLTSMRLPIAQDTGHHLTCEDLTRGESCICAEPSSRYVGTR